MGASIVSRRYAPPIFELGEHILNRVALPKEGLVIGEGGLRLFVGVMQGLMPLSLRALRSQLLS